jgi:predicted ATPase
MKLKVENFGPISHADIEIKPLMVLIGKNNAGKSMLAQLIFTLMTLTEGYRSRRFLMLMPRYMRIRDIIVFPLFRSPLSFRIDFSKRIREAKEVTPHSYVKTMIDVMIDHSTQTLNNTLRDLLERNFAVELKSLVNLYSNYTRVECAYSKYLIIEFIITKEGDLSSKFNIKMEELVDNILKDEEINKLVNRILHSRKGRDFTSVSTIAIERIVELIFPKIVELIFPLLSTLYIPAGRAGLLEGYEAVSSALIALAPTAPLRGISMPPIPGMASEFYSVLLELTGKKGPFEKMSDLFKEMIEGDIVFEELKLPKGKSKMVYKFKFKDKESSIDLIHAASMVKELSPIYLVLRELIHKGHLLIIEEPESHLHPAAQIKLMEIFAKLVNEGLGILITTHSDILLRKLAHLVMEGSTGGRGKAYLKPEDVAVYLLKPDEKGYATQEVNILEEMPTFDEVIDQLYEEEKNLYYLPLQKGNE